MSDPRDQIDAWLDREVDLLPPPPGTFTTIRARAGRRKRNQALLTTAAGVAVAAAAVTVPTVLHSALTGNAQPAASTSTRVITQSPASPPVRSSKPTPRISTSNGSPRSTLVHSFTAPPAHFQPTSMTFVASGRSLLGAAVGQAAPPCAGGKICTSMVSTPDYGSTWHGFSAPRAPGPARPDGVSQVRFISPEVGWAFGPALWATANSGASWTRQQIPGGGRVIDLEGTGTEALALVGSCTGTGANYAATCTSYSLYSYNATAPASGWQPVSLPGSLAAGGQPTGARLVVGGTTGYLLAPDGDVLLGPLSGQGWSKRTVAPCQPAAPLRDGAPAGALLASGSDAGRDDLFEYCPGPSAGEGTISVLTVPGAQIRYSQLRHAVWYSFGTVRLRGADPTSLAGAQNVTVLATTTGIFYAGPAGTWQRAAVAAPLGGFSYVGMTTSLKGIAIPADARLGEIFTTANGGRTWHARPIG